MECTKHRKRKSNEAERESLNRKLRDLPRYGGGDLWRRCPYCAYEKGRQDVLDELGIFMKNKS